MIRISLYPFHIKSPTLLPLGLSGLFALFGCGGNNLQDTCGNGKADPKESCFLAPFVFPSPAPLLDGVLVDLNRDGVLDLAAAAADGTVVLFMGDPGGGFSEVDPARGVVPTGGDPSRAHLARRVLEADIDQNGTSDLVVALIEQDSEGNFFGKAVTLLGNGDGTFQGPRISDLGGAPAEIALFDANQDGRLDLLTFAPNLVETRLGDGSGLFINPQAVALDAPDPGMFALDDLNGDGIFDLLAADRARGVARLFGAQNGSFFFDAGLVPLLPPANALLLEDVSGDGRLDALQAEAQEGFLSIARGLGNGDFEAPDRLRLGNAARAVIALDFNGDGNLDLAASGGSTVGLLSGQGGGLFDQESILWGGSGLFDILAADINRDQVNDLILLGALGVSLLEGRPGDFPRGVPARFVEERPRVVVPGDFDRDGEEDLAVLTDAGIVIFQNQGQGALSPGTRIPLDPTPVALVALDADGDGEEDLASLNPGGESGLLFFHDGEGFAAGRAVPITGLPPGTEGLVALDLNEDGREDLLTLGPNPSFLQSDGEGFLAPVPLGFPEARAAALGDLDGDGEEELIIAREDRLHILRGPGFTASTEILLVGSLAAVAVDELNGDGLADLVALDAVSESLLFLENAGGGSFAAPVVAQAPPGASALALVDTDGDLDAEVAAVGLEASFIVDLAGGVASVLQVLPVGGVLEGFTSADLDGDGAFELLFPLGEAGLIVIPQRR